jgi:hypothetical protein
MSDTKKKPERKKRGWGDLQQDYEGRRPCCFPKKPVLLAGEKDDTKG